MATQQRRAPGRSARSLTVTNPHNGRSLVIRINDTGPYGIAYRMGARLDLARGAAQRLGMTAFAVSLRGVS